MSNGFRCLECGQSLADDDVDDDLCSGCKRELEGEVANCVECGCVPCCCEDSADFCDCCGNGEIECTCPYEDPVDDVEANTRGEIE